MEKTAVLGKITECGVVAVVRTDNAEQAVKITDSCVKAGIAAIEITFTVPGPWMSSNNWRHSITGEKFWWGRVRCWIPKPQG